MLTIKSTDLEAKILEAYKKSLDTIPEGTWERVILTEKGELVIRECFGTVMVGEDEWKGNAVCLYSVKDAWEGVDEAYYNKIYTDLKEEIKAIKNGEEDTLNFITPEIREQIQENLENKEESFDFDKFWDAEGEAAKIWALEDFKENELENVLKDAEEKAMSKFNNGVEFID